MLDQKYLKENYQMDDGYFISFNDFKHIWYEVMSSNDEKRQKYIFEKYPMYCDMMMNAELALVKYPKNIRECLINESQNT